jgi:anti-anti-sigma factor
VTRRPSEVIDARGGASRLALAPDPDDNHVGRHTIVLEGELDMAWAPVLDATVRRACKAGTPALALDLSGLTFMDSTGLRSILLARDTCEKHGCTFLLIQGPAQIKRLFEVAGLIDRLPFESDTSVPGR